MSKTVHDLRRTFDDDRQFACELALGAPRRGGAEAGRVPALSTARVAS